MYILESLAFHAIFFMDSFIFETCMYTFSFDKTYIYLEAYLVFEVLMISGISVELNCPISMYIFLTWFLHSTSFCLPMIFVSWESFVLYRLWVSIIVYLACFHGICICLYSILEGFRTSFQNYFKTSFVIIQLVEFSNMLKYFQIIFLKTPTF